MFYFVKSCANTSIASGQKLIVVNKKGSNHLVNKSQTLPRSMGSRVPATFGVDSRPQRLPTKVATTPPVIRRQFSVNIIPFFNPLIQFDE